jgi:hypothetical protein
MGAFLSRRSVWVPALAAWLVFGLGLSTWLGVATYQRYAPRAADLALHVTGTTPPADMPTDFPLYPGVRVVEYFTQPAAPGSEGVLFRSADSAAAVFAFYRSALNRGPWHVNATLSYPFEEISCLHAPAPVLSCSLVVQPSQTGRPTEFTFEWISIKVRSR